MIIADLIARLEARPFMPFTIIVGGGRRVHVASPLQCSISPDHALVVVALGAAGMEVMTRNEIIAVADLPSTPGPGAYTPVPATAPASDHADHVARDGGNGSIVTWPQEVGGLPVVTAVCRGSGGQAILDLSGTQFDVHSAEAGENYLIIEMTHPCEPGKIVRVMVWPPGTGSLQTFAEAMPLATLLGVLRGTDEQLRRRAKYPEPGQKYFEAIKINERPEPVDENSDEAKAPDRFVIQTNMVEGLPHQWVTESRLLDRAAGAGGEAIVDLYETGLESKIIPGDHEHDLWRLKVWMTSDRGQCVDVLFNPRERTARVARRPSAVPLKWFERQIRLHALYDSFDVLMRVLESGPRPQTEPEVRLVHRDDVVIELWPAEASVRFPLLKPRILGPGDTPVLDLRSTPWGGRVMAADPFVLRQQRPHADPHTVTLQLIATSGTNPYEIAGTLLAINARTRRVTSPNTPGVTTLGVLQHLLREFGSPSVLLENLHEAMDAGENVARAR